MRGGQTRLGDEGELPVVARRHFVIDEASALYAPGLGAVVCYANDSMRHQQFRLFGHGMDLAAVFRVWQLRGRPFLCVVLRNLPPGCYRAAWLYGQLAQDLGVAPNRVTQIDWRQCAFFGRRADAPP